MEGSPKRDVAIQVLIGNVHQNVWTWQEFLDQTSNNTAQSDGLLQKARSAHKTQWFDRICRSKLRRTAFMQWNHHKSFQKFYESGVQVQSENLHFIDRDI